MEVKCKVCKRKPDEIYEYIISARGERISPQEYVIRQEGTYNMLTGKFYCTKCYIKIGLPLGVA
ncbi:hypothetical protein N752_24425 [Desulforamulus aquiferis]|nr:hypothetical protein [Desulforamulus aquiferis]RYD02478.1 hypothetical protein N752_24425 [Desulforamulus aquiferis]